MREPEKKRSRNCESYTSQVNHSASWGGGEHVGKCSKNKPLGPWEKEENHSEVEDLRLSPGRDAAGRGAIMKKNRQTSMKGKKLQQKAGKRWGN